MFPGDRFNRITRGQFRQSLAQLGVLARYAEVESLFWSLDPQGRGYINKHDFYDHLNTHVSSAAASSASLLSLDVPAWNLPALGGGSPGRSPSDSPSPINYSTVHAHRPGTLARSVQKVLEGMLIHLPLLLSICARMDLQQSGFLSNSDFLIAIQETGILASRADLQTAVAALMQCSDVPSSAQTPRAMIPYRDMEKGLTRLCSDLLSPKKRRKHLSTTSVLLAPHEQPRDDLVQQQPEYNMNLVSENGTDALWNCPRRRMNHDHPATKSSFRISEQLAGLQLNPDDDLSYMPSPAHPGLSGSSSNMMMLAADETNGERKQRMNRLALISVLQDLLERRGELKTVMDLHRRADVHGQVTKDDLIEILRTSRLNLNFASVSVHEFVDELYPQLKSAASGSVGVGFLDLLHRINDLLADLSRAAPPAAAGGWQGGSNGQQQQSQQQHRRQKAHTPSYNSPYRYHHAPQQPQQPRTAGAMSSSFSGGHFYSDETAVQRKLLGESRLQDLLDSEQGRRSAAILIRHAFKGVAARELVVPTDAGEYEAICRASDLKHVCYRLGLDLEPSELQFLVQSIDVNASGFVSSHQLLQFFMHLAATPEPVPSTLTANCSTSCSPRQLQGQVHPYAGATPDHRYLSPKDSDAYNKQRKSPPVQAG